MTGGSATGGNDVFNGKNRIYWALVSQDLTAGGHGRSTVNWAWAINWGAGDNCHRVQTSTVVVNGVTVYSTALAHVFSSSHVHTGDWPPVNAAAQGGFAAGTVTIDHDSNGNANVVMTGSHVGSSGPASNSSLSTALPQIPQTVASPSSATATRVSDTQQTIAWTNNSTGTAPYASVKVYRSTDGAGYALIATLGVVTGYSDTTTAANHRYVYAINAVGANGVEIGSAVAAAVYTTPGAPSALSATKLGNNNIRLDWTNNVGYDDAAYTVRIEESQNGGAFAEIASVAGGVATYEHASPSTSVTHTYRVRSRSTTGSLNSSYSSNSNTVTLLATANAPTGLSPSGVSADAAGNIVLSWTHNPADGTPQTKRRVQRKINAGSYADLVNDTSTASSYTVTAGTWTNGDTITWKVSTAGQNGTLGATSAESTITLSAKPTVTINAPGATYDTSLLTVEWGYFQAQSSAQAAWHAALFDASAVLIEAISGTTETQGTFAHAVADGASYTVTASVTSAAGLTSTEDSQAFTVAYALPAAIAIAGSFDSASGFMVLTLTGEEASAGYSGLTLDGTGDYASTPDAAALDITGDIDIRIDLELADWTPAATTVLVAKWVAASNQRSYEVVLTTAGLIRFRMTTNGATGTLVEATSSVAPTPVNNRLSLKIDRNAGVVTFLTSTDPHLTGASWTVLGTTQAAAGTIFASTAVLQVGADGDGTAALTGTVYSVELRNSSDVLVADPVFAAEPAATTTFVDDAGRTWTLAGDAAIVTVVPATQAIATVDVQRQIDGGAWLTILTGVVLDTLTLTATVQDTLPVTVGSNSYRAIAYSALPSSVMSAEDAVTTAETTWGYLSGEGSFATVARFRATPTFAASTSRAKALYHFAGRPKPVQLAGEAVTTTLNVSGKLSSGSGTPAAFEALGLAEGVVCWRGPDGRRMFASLGKMDLGVMRLHELATVAFALTEVDFAEGDQ